jgi:ATP-dependent DNA helicase RecG
MTATPIPRTAAMTVYGDLDYSVLDELPVGRTPVRTSWVDTPEREEKVWAKVREELRRGRQAYVVCALVRTGGGADEAEEDASLDGWDEDDGRLWAAGAAAPGDTGGPGTGGPGGVPPRAAVEERERLAAGELSGYAVGLLHGQLPAKEKEQVMTAFRRGEIQVLVATTVVEVGVDVANATVMVIEDADRFGIAQLHQLRGRVGRSAEQSWCYLLAREVTPDAEKRLQALESTTDGFELAETDLELRGEGTVLGARQKGRNDLKLASLRRDRDLVRLARDVAEAVVARDPLLAENPLLADELRLFVGEEEAEYLIRS